MNPSTDITLDQALRRYGDDLYRLALILAVDTAQAAEIVLRAIRSMAASPHQISETRLALALRMAQTPDRRRILGQRLPAWVRPSVQRAGDGPVLAAIARLPRDQRLSLALLVLPALDIPDPDTLFDGQTGATRILVRDALLALAPIAVPDLDRSELQGIDAPEECHAARAALMLGDTALHEDPQVRGHLALCPVCRDLAQHWQVLAERVTSALRVTLREQRMPPALMARAHSVLQAEAEPGWTMPPWLRLALLPIAVAGLIALLILPRSGSEEVVTQAPPSLPPAELVQRAIDRVYAPPPGSGIWRGRYALRWAFPDRSVAPLYGTLLIDTSSSRHRIQIVHQSGGGPFEFELADERGNLWYAAAEGYAESLYPLISTPGRQMAHFKLSQPEQAGMLRARLEHGVWGIAKAYLKQAAAAKNLRSWGRRSADDGTRLEVISFRGISPLAMPASPSDQAFSQVTVLLAIDGTTGALYEVRELVGPEGGDQVSYTTWRFLEGEWLAEAEVARAFDLTLSWNGIGQFDTNVSRLVDPMLPLVAPETVTALIDVMAEAAPAIQLPAVPPAGTMSAVLLSTRARLNNTTAVYLGAGRRMAIRTVLSEGLTPPVEGAEMLDLGPWRVTLVPRPAQSYQVFARPIDRRTGGPWAARISAQGYTRDEIVATLKTLGSLTPEAYRAQSQLFLNPQLQ